MKKIPTIFLRDPEHRAYVTREPNPDCAWVFAGEGVATLKYDGTCVQLTNDGLWWARREVKPGKLAPANYVPVELDQTTGKMVGWEPIEQSAFAKFHAEALADTQSAISQKGWPAGTYELVGPKINGNPERVDVHCLWAHAAATVLDPVARDFDGLAVFLADFPGEGIVWHHPDGRMAKLKRRDFPAAPAVTEKLPMYEQVYWEAQHALDEILGPNGEDGAGVGLVAEIWLLAEQRDEARAELARWRGEPLAALPAPVLSYDDVMGTPLPCTEGTVGSMRQVIARTAHLGEQAFGTLTDEMVASRSGPWPKEKLNEHLISHGCSFYGWALVALLGWLAKEHPKLALRAAWMVDDIGANGGNSYCEDIPYPPTDDQAAAVPAVTEEV